MSKNPYMPLWIPDYLADTKHLSTEQHGAYLLLLMSMWMHDGVLPRDDTKLARVVGLSTKRWNRISADVLGLCITHVETDTISHKRVTKELRRLSTKSEVKAAAGRKGGLSRSAKPPVEGEKNVQFVGPSRGPTDQPNLLNLMDGPEAFASSHPKQNTKRLARAPATTQNQNNESPNGLSGEQLSGRTGRPEKQSARQVLETALSKPMAKAVLEHRTALKHPLTPFSAARLVAKLADAKSVSGLTADEAAGQMIEHGWRGFDAEWLLNAEARQQSARAPPQEHQTRADRERENWERVLDEKAKGNG